MTDLIEKCTGLQWDKGNLDKNWKKHKVSKYECEQVFFNQPFLVANDVEHSEAEKRWYILGQTDSGRLLFLVFTIRGELIRVISARDMNKKERNLYNEKIKKYPGF